MAQILSSEGLCVGECSVQISRCLQRRKNMSDRGGLQLAKCEKETRQVNSEYE